MALSNRLVYGRPARGTGRFVLKIDYEVGEMNKPKPVACAVLALALLAPVSAGAATFEVNTPADTTVAGGCTTDPTCSLRDALAAASASADPEDVVSVPAGNYGLENGQLETGGAESLTIRGAGARSTVIDGRGASRVFDVGGDTVTIEGLTVTGGVAPEGVGGEMPGDGGGILAFEVDELFLDGVAVSGNTAAQNGGGISAPPEGSAAPSLSVSNSTIADNKVTGGLVEGLGGGIYVLGDLTLTNSTVARNSAESTVGMVQGGGVLAALDPTATEPSEVDILNSTIAGNSVGTGGIGGGLAVYNPTPGVVTELSVKNTIVAGNSGPAGAGDCGAVATLASDHNLSGDASCMFTDGGSKENTDPQLGPLQNNGGETDTLALPARSPAVDAGTNDGCPATDQRGVTRPQGSACDIGAFELAQGSKQNGGGSSSPPPPAAGPTADLRLRIKAKPKAPQVGGKLAFLITATNKGPATATGAIVKGTVPALARKAALKVNGKPACKLAKAKKGKRRLTCRLGDLPPGATKKVKVVVGTPHAGKVRVRARVRSGVSDPNLKDNRATRSARIRS
ncbi:MAG TPA: choice-of-anchor Q domain-containing protein [Solirubrobacterales bacterium]|nr:choice-of-anchor Q domain-containing protein [Solirubrobacterales bacterium]